MSTGIEAIMTMRGINRMQFDNAVNAIIDSAGHDMHNILNSINPPDVRDTMDRDHGAMPFWVWEMLRDHTDPFDAVHETRDPRVHETRDPRVHETRDPRDIAGPSGVASDVPAGPSAVAPDVGGPSGVAPDVGGPSGVAPDVDGPSGVVVDLSADVGGPSNARGSGRRGRSRVTAKKSNTPRRYVKPKKNPSPALGPFTVSPYYERNVRVNDVFNDVVRHVVEYTPHANSPQPHVAPEPHAVAPQPLDAPHPPVANEPPLAPHDHLIIHEPGVVVGGYQPGESNGPIVDPYFSDDDEVSSEPFTSDDDNNDFDL